MVDIKPYFPKLYDGILEIDNLVDLENKLFHELDGELNRILLNQFIVSCDITTIKLYEDMFKIISNINEDVEFRRQRILNRLSMNSAFSLRFLKQKLNEIIGEGNYTIKIDNFNYILYVESQVINQKWFHEVYVTINKIKPANIVFINKPLINENIVVNEELSYAVREYNYRLGTKWRLGRSTFKSINEKGVIKMPEGKSIQDNLLTDIKNFTIDKVSYVKINNNLVINEFMNKTIQNNNVVIEYAVKKSEGLIDINKVDLYDSENKLLTSISLYIPVIDDLELKHIIKIQEGVR